MGDFNQYKWIESKKDLIVSPVLEIGSKFYSKKTFFDYRKLCKGKEYTGCDLSTGKNVDIAIDFTENIDVIRNKLGNKFNSVLCFSVMEHVKNIDLFAKNISHIMNSNGILFLSVPFTWEFHGYPNDYWRFTPAAIEYLFPDFDFPIKYRTISSHIDMDIEALGTDPNNFTYSIIQGGSNKPSGEISFYQLIKAAFEILRYKKTSNEKILFRSLNNTRFFKPSCINMIGIKNG